MAAGKEFDAVYDEAKRMVGRGFVTDYIFSGEPFVLEARPHYDYGRFMELKTGMSTPYAILTEMDSLWGRR